MIYIDGNISYIYIGSEPYDEVFVGSERVYPAAPSYFTTVARSGGTINFSGSVSSNTANTLSYSTDNGTTWSTASQTPSVNVNAGVKVLWKGTCTPNSTDGIGRFTNGTATFDVEGNAMSLLFGDNFSGQTSLGAHNYAFYGLFSGNTKVINAENLSLPATTLGQYCYRDMFKACTGLTTAPELPATAMTEGCYYGMFQGTSLTTPPALPATSLAKICYAYMFMYCTGLTSTPALPATTLAQQCYASMFYSSSVLPDCTNIDFGDTHLVRSGGLMELFAGTKVTDNDLADILPINADGNYCLPEATLSSNCYYAMFQDCTGLTTAPVLPVTTLKNSCYNSMFNGCTSLNSITCLATDISAVDCTLNWVNGVASSGTFYKDACMDDWTTGSSGIPSGWTVVDVGFCSPKLSLRTRQGVFNKDCDSSTTITSQDVTGLVSDKTAILEATIGDCVQSIGDGALSAVTNMTDVHIPSSVTMIGMDAFKSCSSLQSVVILGQYLSDNAFMGCYQLTLLELVDVSYIGVSCFRYTSYLTSVTVPATCEEIASCAFADGTSLQEVTMLGDTPPTLGEDVFYNCDMLTAIYVPHGALQAYLDEPSWQPYASLLVESPE